VSANPTDNVISCYMGLELDARASLVFGLGPSGDGSVGDGSDGDLGLTVTQLGLIERLRKAVLVIDKTKQVVKQVKENFLRVNNGMRDGVMPAEEGEAVLAVYFEQIGKFLGGNLVEHPRVKGERECSWAFLDKEGQDHCEVVIYLGLWGSFLWVLLVSFEGSCILGILVAFCYSAFGTFFGCTTV
jgi:hypothetical protein